MSGFLKNTVLISLVAIAVNAQALTTVKAATTEADTKTSNDFGQYGVWSGSIYNFATNKLKGDSQEKIQIAIVNCGEQPNIFIYDSGGIPNSIYNGLYKINSRAGNHIMSVIVDGGWVETQNWSLISKDNDNLVVQWSRQVSNPMLTNDDPLRAFGQMGYGEIEKTSESCNTFKENGYIITQSTQ